MNWTDLTSNIAKHLNRLKARFPNIDETEMYEFTDKTLIVDHVAARHDLTPVEAREEIDDWLFVESLARQASELRAG